MESTGKRVHGTWQALTGILAGKEMSADIVAATRLTVSENSYEVNLAGTIDSGWCTIDEKADPIRMKIDGMNGPNAGRTFFAIVEFLSHDKIQIAYDLSGTQYPTSFTPGSASSSYVATFKKC